MRRAQTFLLRSLLILWVAALPSGLRAHRLDECLQAARITVNETNVDIELDLTPGAETAARFHSLIDLDRDGKFSAAETAAFADRVKTSLKLELNREQPALVASVDEFPMPEEIATGSGIIRLHLTARHSALKPGQQRLTFQNRYQPAMSVYLVNALKPASARIRVTRQDRNESQSDYTLEFSVE